MEQKGPGVVRHHDLLCLRVKRAPPVPVQFGGRLLHEAVELGVRPVRPAISLRLRVPDHVEHVAGIQVIRVEHDEPKIHAPVIHVVHVHGTVGAPDRDVDADVLLQHGHDGLADALDGGIRRPQPHFLAGEPPPAGIAGLPNELPGLCRIVGLMGLHGRSVVLRELGRDHGVGGDGGAAEQDVRDDLPVDRPREGLPDTHVVEGRLPGAVEEVP